MLAHVSLLLALTATTGTPSPVARPAELAVVTSGGVSLGAYEAGFLYYALAANRLSRDSVQLRIATGASAGSLNGLLAILAACGADAPAPTESLFWRTWIPMGLHELFKPADATAVGAFSRHTLEEAATRVQEVWDAGLSGDCDVVLGVSTTRLEPRRLRVAGGRLELPRVEEKFAVRIRGRGAGRPPLATNYADPRDPLGPRLLVTDAEGAIAFSSLRDLLLASMAFPVAFPPVAIPSCPVRGGVEQSCLASAAETSLYVDGGVLDNAPLRLAVRIAGAGLWTGPDGRLGWRELPAMRSAAVPDELFFAYLAPEIADHPSYEPTSETDATSSLVALLSRVTRGFIETARAKELSSLVEESPDLVGKMVPPQRHFPAASAPLAAFLGFFEREFRVFDFYLGMYDARRTYEEALQRQLRHDQRPAALVYPEPPAGDAQRAWGPFLCLRAVFDGVGSSAEACGGGELAGFRALAQASLERLYSDCRLTADAAGTSGDANAHCRRAREGADPPAVPGVPAGAPGEWIRGRTEGELDYALRLLSLHRFAYSGLGSGALSADEARLRIRSEVQRIGLQLAAKQPRRERPLVAFAAEAAADAVAYVPPEDVLHFTLGPVPELGWSRGLAGMGAGRRVVRVAIALQLRGAERVVSSGAHDWAAGAVAGVEVQPRWGGPFSQLRFGARGGYEFASGDDFGRGSCDLAHSDQPGTCSRPVVQGIGAVSLLGRLRFQLVGAWYPALRAGEHAAWSFTPGFGVEFGL